MGLVSFVYFLGLTGLLSGRGCFNSEEMFIHWALGKEGHIRTIYRRYAGRQSIDFTDSFSNWSRDKEKTRGKVTAEVRVCC